MIKLNDQLSSVETAPSTLGEATLTTLSQAAKINFIASRAIAGGYYVIDFQPISAYQNCYPHAFIDTVIARLQTAGNVSDVEPNELLSVTDVANAFPILASVPNPSANQWDLASATGGIYAPIAWAITMGNRNAITAVLDTGVLNNDSLSPNLLLDSAASFYDSGYVAKGAASRCSTCSAAAHGTHVSGTIASTGNGAYGQNMYGIAYHSQVLPVNVFSKITSCSGGVSCLGAYNSDIYNALSWLGGSQFSALGAAPNIVAINMSFAGTSSCSTSWQNAITTLYNKNVTLIAAAANNNANASSYNPANCNNVITVAATGPSNQKAYYSNYGSVVEIAAPGGDSSIGSVPNTIYSTLANSYGFFQGTSMAAPHVAGLVSLLYALDPTMTPTRALELMQTTASSFATGTGSYYCDPNSAGHYCGAGIINAGAAVTALNNDKATFVWTPNFVENSQSTTVYKISWDPATWSNLATTAIHYSVVLDGVAVSNCQYIIATNCTLTTTPFIAHSFTVSATDYRHIMTPVSQSGSVGDTLIAPTLINAVRNPNLSSEVWLKYSSLGSDVTGETYTVNNLPSNVTINLDEKNQRFVLENVDQEEISNVSVIMSYLDFDPVSSNEVNIASKDVIAPQLTYAVRDQTLLTSAWIYYNNLGSTDTGNVYTIFGLPSGASLNIDAAHHRFIVSNITIPEAAQIYIQVSNAELGRTVQTISIRLPSIAG